MDTQTEKRTLSGLELFFQTMLQEIYWCKLHLRDVLESMEQRASAEELKSIFRTHRKETDDHVSRLERVFYLKDMGAHPVFCVGMQGLFDEGWQVIDETGEDSAHRDAALIVAAQKIEHYEIAAYGSLSTLAKTIGFQEAVDPLEQTLSEEKKTDRVLTLLAEKGINPEASIEAAAEDEFPSPPDTDNITTESEPAIDAMKEGITGMDAGAGSQSTREEAKASTLGSADALLVDDSGQPKGRKRSTRKKPQHNEK